MQDFGDPSLPQSELPYQGEISTKWPPEQVITHLQGIINEEDILNLDQVIARLQGFPKDGDSFELERLSIESIICFCDYVRQGRTFEWFDTMRVAIKNGIVDTDLLLEYNDITWPGVYPPSLANETYDIFGGLKKWLNLDNLIVKTTVEEYGRHYERKKDTDDPLLTAVVGCGEMTEIKELFEKHAKKIKKPTVVVGIDTSPIALARAEKNFKGMENVVIEKLYHPYNDEGESLADQINRIKQRAHDENINIVALLEKEAEVALESLQIEEGEDTLFDIISTVKSEHHIPRKAKQKLDDMLPRLTKTYIQDDMFRAGDYRPEEIGYDSRAGRFGLGLLFNGINKSGGVTMLHGGMVSMLKALGRGEIIALANKLVGMDAEEVEPSDVRDMPGTIEGRNAIARLIFGNLIPLISKDTLLGSYTMIVDYNQQQQLLAA